MFPMKVVRCFQSELRLLMNDRGSPSVLVSQTRFLMKHVDVPNPGNGKQYRFRVELPEKYTVAPLKMRKLGGRDPVTGRVVVGTLGGGAKRRYRWIDVKREANADGSPLVEKVLRILYDPNRNAAIALTACGDSLRYRIASATMKAGDLISTYSEIPRIPVRPLEADAHPVGALPVGTEVSCIEQFPGKGGFWCKSGGSYATVVRKVGSYVTIRLPSKRPLSVHEQCMCVVGRVMPKLVPVRPIGSAWRKRWLGYRPRSGLWHRKDGRFGRKIKQPPPVVQYDQIVKKKQEYLQLDLVDRAIHPANWNIRPPNTYPAPGHM